MDDSITLGLEGIKYYKAGKYSQAESLFHKSLEIKENANTLINLAVVYRELHKPKEAKNALKRSIRIDPRNSVAYNNLANVYNSLGDKKKSMTCFIESLKLDPKNESAIKNLGMLYSNMSEFELALKTFKTSPKNNYLGRIAECLFHLGHYKEFWSAIEEYSEYERVDMKCAAISAYASNQLDEKDLYNFCPNPLDFIYKTTANFFNPHILDLYKNTKANLLRAKDLRRQELIKNGEQTGGNYFDSEDLTSNNLQDFIDIQVNDYYRFYKSFNNNFIKKWPKKYQLYGWGITLTDSGNLSPHNHTTGWVSGSFYIQIPKNLEKNEASIFFSLYGDGYPVLNENKIPTKILDVKTGDIVIFPSSLFHGTIPFKSNDKRICFAFDQRPEWYINDFSAHY
ncbi:putative 2OG-Fe(II) oxygenase [Hyphomicrobiales bacterium]|nr:putative 2OG-Fe(II) oxygenase [Hyphomicrobiales bacterium]